MARSIDLDRPGPPCIKEEVNPASAGRTTAATEYCVSLQRLWADCGVTAGDNAELSSESDAAALSMDEVGLAGPVLRLVQNLVLGSAGIGAVFSSQADWSLPCALWYQANGGLIVKQGRGSNGSSVWYSPSEGCCCSPASISHTRMGCWCAWSPGHYPVLHRQPAPRQVRPKARRGGGVEERTPQFSSGTLRRPSPSATAPTRSFPLTHCNAASSDLCSIYAVVAAWAQTRARSINILLRPSEHSERSSGVPRRFPHIPDDLSPHNGSAPQENLRFRRPGMKAPGLDGCHLRW
ncbi:hypothetical protein NDU88_001605 [Pleurodeles waltl]|uniref:Uncharacterized protein n=1 Tax=Pleurodeles waltl TaxID=8319 RepID=A0AAV7VAF9_PLEWA|nr:hypothetical protein NDU88_001605 [Pleurodeles waltl]